ncbi:hypothetical protein BG006_005345 [Podila minutissima]|uniref:Uncharacterized protein n=1 Tax=Podila minutissima TaxID=64525 RepID=A0A9P5ST33_9FUNG|nr:hypothetical protein BG006_005345 [Podila minutissima]
MYPKGLLPHNPLSDHFQKPAVPYVSELFAKASTSPPSSANTSRDLEMVIAGITGRLGRTNRTSLEPWPYSPWDDKPLPTVRREPGERYWVFRDTDGLVLGPILFILGHLCPVLWWVGAVYPATRHPSDIKRVGIRKKYQASRARLWFCDRWEVKVKGVIKPLFVRSKADVGSLESVVTHSHECVSVVGGATVGASQVRVPIQGAMEEEGVVVEEVTTRGPWSADSSDHASSLFEQKMEYDRKVLRYELDLRWRRMNLAWSVGSFVLAIAITAVVIAASM